MRLQAFNQKERTCRAYLQTKASRNNFPLCGILFVCVEGVIGLKVIFSSWNLDVF